MIKAFLLAALMWPLYAFGISHVGGGKVKSQSLGVEAKINFSLFHNIVNLDNDSVYFQSLNRNFTRMGPGFSNFYISEVHNLISEAQLKIEMEQLKQWLEKDGWEQMQSHYDCLLRMKISSNTTVNEVYIWGKGTGISISYPNNTFDSNAAEKFFQSIHLTEGCKWN